MTNTMAKTNESHIMQAVQPTYRMKMVFALDISDPIINSMTEMIDGTHPTLMNALTCTLELTRQGVPTEDELVEYEKAIKRAYTTDRIHVDRVTFRHYASIKEI